MGSLTVAANEWSVFEGPGLTFSNSPTETDGRYISGAGYHLKCFDTIFSILFFETPL